MRLLLTHAYFSERRSQRTPDHEALCAAGHSLSVFHLRSKGFEVDIYDLDLWLTEELFGILDAGPPAGMIYGNLMTAATC